MKTFAKMIVLATMVCLATYGFTQTPPMGGPNHLQMLKHLGLTEDQSKQVEDLVSKFRTSEAPQKAQLKVLNAQIELAMTASTPDQKAVNALVDKKALLRADLEKQFLAMAAQVHAIVGDQIYLELRQHLKMTHRHRAWSSWFQRPNREPAEVSPAGPRT